MSLWDSIGIVAAIMAFVIAVIVAGLVYQSFNTAIQASDVSQAAKDNAQALDTGWPGAMDWIFAALLFGLPLASMGLAYFNNIPSVFFYAVLAMLFLMVFIGWGLQSGYEQMVTNGGAFASYAVTKLPITDFVMKHFGFYALLVVAIIGFGTYVKANQSGVGVGI